MSRIHSTCTTLLKTYILKVILAKNMPMRYDISRYVVWKKLWNDILLSCYNLGRHELEGKYKVAAKNVV